MVLQAAARCRPAWHPFHGRLITPAMRTDRPDKKGGTLRRAIVAGLALASLVRPADAVAQQLAASRTMLATVLDRAGRPTVDVGPDDFVVEEGNDEREILTVQVADYPVALVLDNVADAAESLAAIRQAAARFIQRIGQRPVAIGTLADPPSLVASFDDDRAAVLATVERIAAAERQPLRPLALLTTIADRIAAFGSPFAVVVVVSAGAVDPADQPEADRIAPIVESGAAIHVIARRPAGFAVSESAPDLLRALSEQTRGQFIPIYNTVSYGIALDRLADQLSTEMMIDYLVPPGSSGENARIGIRVPGATVRGLGVSK